MADKDKGYKSLPGPVVVPVVPKTVSSASNSTNRTNGTKQGENEKKHLTHAHEEVL